MTDRRKPPSVGPMTRDTAVVFNTTELLRYPLSGDLTGLYRESVALTMLAPEFVAAVMSQLACVATHALLLAGGNRDDVLGLLDRLMVDAQFDQLTQLMKPTTGGPTQ